MSIIANRIIRDKVSRQVRRHKETGYGRIIAVYATDGYCTIETQTSAKQIRLYFPQNASEVPSYCKKGNAVTYRHTGGNSGRRELIGPAIIRPTPYSGSDYPSVSVPVDAILSGLRVKPFDSNSMKVVITTGTARFSGSTFSYGAHEMGDSSMVMGASTLMGETATVKTLNSAPGAGSYRYDIFVIGSDMVVDYIAGSASASPIMPDVPSGHLLLPGGWVLVYGGMTAVKLQDIGKTFVAAMPSILEMTFSDSDLAWAELTSTITLTIKDQYGKAIAIPGGCTFTLTIAAGNGTISQGGSSSTSELAIFSTGSSIAFTYTRDQIDPGDSSPSFSASINTGLAAGGVIILRDVSGNIMT